MHLAFQLFHLLFVEGLLEIVLVKGWLSRSLTEGKWGGKVKNQQRMEWLLHIWNFWFQRLLNFQKTNKKYCYDVQRSLGERYKSEFLQPHGRRWWRFCHNLGAAFQLVVSESGMHHHLESISSLFSVTLITNTLPIFLALYKGTRSGSRLA